MTDPAPDPILQRHLPPDMYVARALPGIQPERGAWLRVDEAYAGQMARRLELLRDVPERVHYLEEAAMPAAQELLATVLAALPDLGFQHVGETVTCPDGRKVDVSSTRDPLRLLGQLVQNDFVLMEKRGDEHVLSGGILCFPASWKLSEKAGLPLTGLHVPVQEYTPELARRVQRLFDGVQVGRPLWRFNQLWYDDPELFQPRSIHAPRVVGTGQTDGPFLRSERQTLMRLPLSRAVVFVIHTYVLARADVPALT
mmetsp:Transcript_17967/g.27346  ORF Transcript_17967/g.27346 Transcript_17967/m.27346 type:complete len:255 (-) Transcript_17967:731-1495(-)